MNKVILDASALLVLINQESGCDFVSKYVPNAVMSVVNVSEVATVLVNIGMSIVDARQLIGSLVSEVEPFLLEQAYRTAQLRTDTKKYGLSFGDRACLSLAQMKKMSVITADKVWTKLKVGVLVKPVH